MTRRCCRGCRASKFVSFMHSGDMSLQQVAALLSIQRASTDLKWVLERTTVVESGVGARGDFGLLAEYWTSHDMASAPRVPAAIWYPSGNLCRQGDMRSGRAI